MPINNILKKYTNPSESGSFSGLSGFLKNNKNFSKRDIEKTLLNTPTYTLHKPKRIRFKRCRVVVSGIDEQWQIDLVDVKNIKGSNYGTTFILTCIDVFSKFAWAIPLKNKEAKTCMLGLEQIIKDSGRKPISIYLDNGKEFLGEFKKLCGKYKINILPTKSLLKASIVERFNRTLKEKMWRVFTYNNENKKKFPQNFTTFLKQLVSSYNNSYHRSIKTKPANVNKTNETAIYETLFDDQSDLIVFKYKIGNYVRISNEKPIFSKGYTQNWSKDIYIIRNLIPSNPPRYLIKDLEGVNYPYKFYTEELQRVLYEEFPFDTLLVLKETSNKILVEKLNSDKKELWLNKNDG